MRRLTCAIRGILISGAEVAPRNIEIDDSNTEAGTTIEGKLHTSSTKTKARTCVEFAGDE